MLPWFAKLRGLGCRLRKLQVGFWLLPLTIRVALDQIARMPERSLLVLSEHSSACSAFGRAVSHPAYTLSGTMNRTAWDDWIFELVRDRRDKVHHGPRTLIVLQGSSAVGKTTVARCLARRHGVASVDTNALKRGMGITHDQLLEHAEMEPDKEWFVEIDGYYRYGWKGAAASASLSAVLLAAEAMDQGSHAVIAGLENAWLRSFREWEEVVALLVAPHRMFGVRLVVDPSVRIERLRQRSSRPVVLGSRRHLQ